MISVALSSHEILQDTADALVAQYTVDDTEVLRFALIEVLQNVVQHGNGFCVIELRARSIACCNIICDGGRDCSHLGLRMVKGIQVEQRGSIFRATVHVHDVALCMLDLDHRPPAVHAIAS